MRLGIGSYVIRRAFAGVLVVIGVTIITFLISRVAPGDPVALILGPHYTVTKAEQLKHKLGLDKPLPIQYCMYLTSLARGDFGTSMRTNRPIIEDFKDHFPATLELTLLALSFSFIIGIPLGIISSTRRNSLTDHFVRIFSLSGVSMPVFWLGLLMLLFFYLQLGWFPAGGRLSLRVTPPPSYTGLYILDSLLAGDWSALGSSLWHVLLPAFTLGFCIIGQVTRMTRASMLEVLRQDYITTSRAKGLQESAVIYKHALKNAIAPVITLAGVLFGRLMAGAVLTETIFSWPGIGLYAVNAILHLDYQPIIAFTTIVAIIYTFINIVVDISYAYINPKVHLE